MIKNRCSGGVYLRLGGGDKGFGVSSVERSGQASINPFKMQNAKIKMQNERAKVRKFAF